MAIRPNCRNCGAPLPPDSDACAYCGQHRYAELPGEFGFRSHAWLWAGLAVVAIATVALGVVHFQRETWIHEGRDWALMFGVAPALLFVVAALWGPRRGRWGSAVFTLVPAVALTLTMAVQGELHDVDMLGYPAASAGACLAYYVLGSALHLWIVKVRSPGTPT